MRAVQSSRNAVIALAIQIRLPMGGRVNIGVETAGVNLSSAIRKCGSSNRCR
jgi:hypothetical protein